MTTQLPKTEMIDRWQNQANEFSFLDVHVSELDRDGLLAVIGHLIEKNRVDVQMAETHGKMLGTFAAIKAV